MAIYLIEKQNHLPKYRMFNVISYDHTELAFNTMNDKEFFEFFDEDTQVYNCEYVHRDFWDKKGYSGTYDVFRTDTGIWFFTITCDDTKVILQGSYRGSMIGMLRSLNDYIDTLCD